jgi:hypothetical protein
MPIASCYGGVRPTVGPALGVPDTSSAWGWQGDGVAAALHWIAAAAGAAAIQPNRAQPTVIVWL